MQIMKKTLAAVILGSTLIIPAVTHASSTKAGLPTISLAMNGKTITVNGALQSGAVNIRMTTTGEHMAAPIFVWLKPGVTVQQLYAFLHTRASQDPNTVSRFGSIVMDTGVPGGVSNVQTVLRPGQYIALDSSRQNQQPWQWPHATFSITQAAQPAALPSSQATIHIVDFGFVGPTTLRAGTMLRIYNNGFVVHMAVAIGAKSQQGASQIAMLLQAGKGKQAQPLSNGDFLDFAGPLSHGGGQQFAVTAKPGFYVLACFMDTQDHREHVRLNMVRVIRIIP